MKNKWKTARTISYIILILYAIISLFPFFWAIIVSMTPLTYTDAQNVERGVDIMQWPPKIDLFSSEPSALEHL